MLERRDLFGPFCTHTPWYQHPWRVDPLADGFLTNCWAPIKAALSGGHACELVRDLQMAVV
jgi:hypothetical protein